MKPPACELCDTPLVGAGKLCPRCQKFKPPEAGFSSINDRFERGDITRGPDGVPIWLKNPDGTPYTGKQWTPESIRDLIGGLLQSAAEK